MKITVKSPPISSSNPAVPNMLTVDLAVTAFSERLTRKEKTIAKIHITTQTAAKPVMNGINAL